MIEDKIILKNGLQAKINPASHSDAQELLKCFKMIAAEDRFVLSTLADIEKIAPSIEKEEEWIKNTFESGGLILTAKINGQTTGYVSVCVDQMVRRRHIANISICILKQYRSIGIGKALMRAVIKWAKENPNIEKIALSVFADNISAIKLYEKFGFSIEGRLIREIKRRV